MPDDCNGIICFRNDLPPARWRALDFKSGAPPRRLPPCSFSSASSSPHLSLLPARRSCGHQWARGLQQVPDAHHKLWFGRPWQLGTHGHTWARTHARENLIFSNIYIYTHVYIYKIKRRNKNQIEWQYICHIKCKKKSKYIRARKCHAECQIEC